MYEAFREAPQSKKDRSRLKLGLWITLAAVLLAMVSCSVLAVSFSSIFYILLSGAAGLAVYGVQQLRKEAGAK